MRTIRTLLAFTFVVATASASAQQGPPPRPRQGPPQQPGMSRGAPIMGRMDVDGPNTRQPGPPGGGLASILLAHTAELKLTDQQLTKLAAVARRTETRHTAMRTTMDSLARANHPQGDAAQQPPARPMPDAMRALMDRARDQERADLRDALAILTIDQLADAWLMRGRGGPGERSPMGPPGGRPGR
ncbi:MAG: hypothetical protein ABI625_17035 [bacterium]